MDKESLPEQDYRPRKIYRSRTDRLLFGVCGGIAEYYGIESLWVRIVFIFLGITGAIGFILYMALVVLMPLNPIGSRKTDDLQARADQVRERVKDLADELKVNNIERRRNLLGLVIVAVGVIAFLNELFPNFWMGWKVLWPIIIILIGFSFISDARSPR